MKEKLELLARKEPDTKNKRKYLFGVLGISGGIYIDKMVPMEDQPEKLVITIPRD